MYDPQFRITPTIAKALMTIEACRQAIDDLPVTVTLLTALRETARLQATHYSTQIEGNRLTLAQVQDAISGAGQFQGQERDAREVRHYFQALDEVDVWSRQQTPITEEQIQILHGLVMEGRHHPTPYRQDQNVIRDSRTDDIVYMPPEATDVQILMTELVAWINQRIATDELPLPIVAALFHYQLATIHPYFDGNGRTARLLTTLILHRFGYGLKGIYALEEYYAQNLPAYYEALAVGPSHHYYMGRAEADITAFVAYFCLGMAEACTRIRHRAETLQGQGAWDQSPMLRELSAQQRRALTLFTASRRVTARELATFFSISPRQASHLCRTWTPQGFLEVAEAAKKFRSYQLAPRYETLVSHGLNRGK